MGRWKDLEPHLVRDIGEYNDSRPKHLRFMTRQQFRNYDKKVADSEGFDVDDCPGYLTGRIVPIPKGSKEWRGAQRLAVYAAICNEDEFVNGLPMKSVDLIKANYHPVCGLMYYLTFRGIDSESVEATYRTKVWLKPGPSLKVLSFDKVPDSKLQPKPKKSESKVTYKPVGKLSAVHGFYLLVAQIWRAKPNLTYKRARKAASSKWKYLSRPEKKVYTQDAGKVIEIRGRITLFGL